MGDLACLFGFHRWEWFSLQEAWHPFNVARISQCANCRRIAGGWRGKRDHSRPSPPQDQEP